MSRNRMNAASKLRIVLTAIDGGFPASALVLAADLGVSFDADTLNGWVTGPRQTFAALVLNR
jgi:hypothetical protein